MQNVSIAVQGQQRRPSRLTIDCHVVGRMALNLRKHLQHCQVDENNALV